MNISVRGINLIIEFEGMRTHAYPDPATGGEPWTIGVGHTSAAGPPEVHKGLVISLEEAEAILRRDVKVFEKHVPQENTTQNQFDAMVSLCFNIGPGNFNKSSVKKFHLAGNYMGAVSSFLAWNKAAGKVMSGLTRRRKAEADLYGTV